MAAHYPGVVREVGAAAPAVGSGHKFPGEAGCALSYADVTCSQIEDLK